MKFRFCGDLDCPDWVLAEITTLSRITSVKMKLMCQQVMSHLLAHAPINYDKVDKLTSDAKYTTADVKGAIAAVDFVFCNAGKNGVGQEMLSNELQQLGLPKELSTALCKVYNDSYEKLCDVLRTKSLRLSTLRSVDWRVDYVASCSSLEYVGKPEVHVKVVTSPTEDVIHFTASERKFRVLLQGLREAYKCMEDVSHDGSTLHG